MRLFVTKPRASQLVGVIAIEPSADVSANEAAELAESHLNDATLALLFDRLAREGTVEPPAETAKVLSPDTPPIHSANRAMGQVARVTANNCRLVRELEGAARVLHLGGAGR